MNYIQSLRDNFNDELWDENNHRRPEVKVNIRVWYEDACKHVSVESPTLHRRLSLYISTTSFEWMVIRHATFTPSGRLSRPMQAKYYASFDEAKREFDRYSPKGY